MAKGSGKAAFEKEVHGLFEQVFRQFGLDQLSTRLISLLYMEPGEISMDDLALKSGYSLSAVSTKMRVIQNLGMVEERRKPGSKKLYYHMEKDLKKLNLMKAKKALEISILPMKQHIPQILQKYKSESSKSKDPEFSKKYKLVENYYSHLVVMEGLLKEMIRKLEMS